jgi:hypothetical protein
VKIEILVKISILHWQFLKLKRIAGCWWLIPVILATQDTDQEDHGSKSALDKYFMRPYLEKLNMKN